MIRSQSSWQAEALWFPSDVTALLLQPPKTNHNNMREFPKMEGGLPYFGVLIIRILLCRVLYLGPPIFGNAHMAIATSPRP